MTAYDLNNPLLVDTTLSDCWVDLQLPEDLLQQMKGELKTPSISLKEVNLAPVKPGDRTLKISGDFEFTLFLVLNFETSFTPTQFVKSLNESFNKFIPKHQLVSLKKNNIVLNLMPGQTLFLPNAELLTWLIPDNIDTSTELLKAQQVMTTPLSYYHYYYCYYYNRWLLIDIGRALEILPRHWKKRILG